MGLGFLISPKHLQQYPTCNKVLSKDLLSERMQSASPYFKLYTRLLINLFYFLSAPLSHKLPEVVTRSVTFILYLNLYRYGSTGWGTVDIQCTFDE